MRGARRAFAFRGRFCVFGSATFVALAFVVPETYNPVRENIEVELTFLRDVASKFLNGALNDASHHSNQTFGRLYTRTHSVGLQ